MDTKARCKLDRWYRKGGRTAQFTWHWFVGFFLSRKRWCSRSLRSSEAWLFSISALFRIQRAAYFGQTVLELVVLLLQPLLGFSIFFNFGSSRFHFSHLFAQRFVLILELFAPALDAPICLVGAFAFLFDFTHLSVCSV